MLATGLLLGLLAIATVTDVRRQKIYNWITYPGILLALVLNGAASLWHFDAVGGGSEAFRWWGFVGFGSSVAGLLLCGAVMIVCYVFFPGGVGGGDIKLIAMMGAMMGAYDGLEAMLWTFVFGGAVALIMLVWNVGVVNIVTGIFRFVRRTLRVGSVKVVSEEERKPLKTNLYLAPSALAAVLMVHARLMGWY